MGTRKLGVSAGELQGSAGAVDESSGATALCVMWTQTVRCCSSLNTLMPAQPTRFAKSIWYLVVGYMKWARVTGANTAPGIRINLATGARLHFGQI